MLGWLEENSSLVNTAANLGMLGVWLLYLQLFYASYRRGRAPNLLIHQANGFDLGAVCLVANMSQNHVHVAALLVDARRGEDEVVFRPGPAVPEPWGGEQPGHGAREGPLAQASYVIVGRFRALVAEAETALPEPNGEDDLSISVRVVAFVGPEAKPVGARRTFRVRGRGADREVRPVAVLPQQLSNRRQRRVARAWLEEAEAIDRARVVTYEEEERSLEELARLDEVREHHDDVRRREEREADDVAPRESEERV